MSTIEQHPALPSYQNRMFDWAWIRRTIDVHFDKVLLAVLIVVAVGLACLADMLALTGHWGFRLNWASREWLREQTALLIGALLGLMRGDRADAKEQQPK